MISFFSAGDKSCAKSCSIPSGDSTRKPSPTGVSVAGPCGFGKFAPVAARLDALAALGRKETLERDAPPLLRPGTYLEPFALRALGVVRCDPTLVEQAARRFDATALAWHAAQTRRILAARPALSN